MNRLRRRRRRICLRSATPDSSSVVCRYNLDHRPKLPPYLVVTSLHVHWSIHGSTRNRCSAHRLGEEMRACYGVSSFPLLGRGRLICDDHSSRTFTRSPRNSPNASSVIAPTSGSTSRVSSVRVPATRLANAVARVSGLVLVGLDVF